MRNCRNGFSVSEHFYGYELECHGVDNGFACCGGSVIVTPKLVDSLELIRERAESDLLLSGREAHGLRVNRGFSCAAYNKHLGGQSDSHHLTGNAADLNPASIGYEDPVEFAVLCVKVGNEQGVIKGVGCYRAGRYQGKSTSFVHIQVEEARRASMMVGVVGIWGDFPQLQDYYKRYPELYGIYENRG